MEQGDRAGRGRRRLTSAAAACLGGQRYRRDARRRRDRQLAACGLALVTVGLVLFALGAAAAPGTRATASPSVREVRLLDSEQTGTAAPVGLAFSVPAGRLYAVGARKGQGAADTDVSAVELSPGPAGSASAARIAAAVQDPINVAFDPRGGRLLLLGHAGELLAVKADAAGALDPQALDRRDAARLRLRDPQGLAVDSAGTVFVLDAAGPRIVRVEPGADGSLDTAATAEIDLRPAGLAGPRGLAVDPASGHFHVRSGRALVELDRGGSVVASRELSRTSLVDPQALVFAPSGDRTDDPAQQSLYVADAGGSGGTGGIVELSLASPVAAASAQFTSSLVRTVDLGALSPPSTDSAGITYVPGTDRFVVVDSEVEETVAGITHFQGANVWELSRLGAKLRTANISKVAPTSVPMANEPAGIAFHPGNGHYYVSDDGVVRIFDLNPGADGLIGTPDDTWSSFVPTAENTDPEGIAVDAFSGRLYVVDGVNAEVYEYTTAGQYVGQFDVAQYGISDPESVEFNARSGTLFVLSDRDSGTGTERLIVETTTGGAHVQTIDVGASNAIKPGGLAHAPASDGSGAMRFYVVDRGVDNNNDPNAVDGKLYELTAPAPAAPANTPPTVDAGAPGTATLPAGVALDGTVSDDGKPNPPGAVTVTWTQVSGPGLITFANANATDTTASATGAGVYVVRLTANDSQYSAADDVTITFQGGGTAQSLDVQVSVGADDAEERPDTVTVVGNADLDLMSESGGTPETNAVVGIRFRNVAIPRGATITYAYVQFQARRAHSGATQLTLRGQNADNAAIFTTANADISSRQTTAAAVAWAPDPWLAAGHAGDAQRTPNIAAIVDEIVDRPGWASGNALALLVTGSGSRVAESFNGVAAGAPRLHVEWTSGAGGNGPPSITSDGGGDTASRSVAENGTAVTTVTANDPDPDALTYSISGGADAARFTIGSSTGALAFVAAPNFEAPVDANGDNVYGVTVQVSDGNGGLDTQALSVTVVNVNEFTPAITSNGGGPAASVSRAENQTGVTTVTATDGDGDPLAYAIAGGADADSFQVGASTGVLSFVTAPDFESPADEDGDNVYEVTVEASDGSLSDAQALSVEVTDAAEGGQNAAPTASAGSNQTVTLPASASLDGTVSDDGQPNPPGALTTTWSKVSGPGTVTFGNANAVDTTASFSAPGTYTLRLTASDSVLSASGEVTVTVNPAPASDGIFADGFESGSLSAWSASSTGGGDLAADAAAAFGSAFGMRAAINDNNSIFVTDDTPAAETRYRARFYFHPNAIAMAKNNAHFLFFATNAGGTAVVRVELRFNRQYQLRVGVLQDGGGNVNSAWIDVTNAWHPVEIDWRAATAAGANNGGVTLWIDGVERAALATVDNDTRRVESARLGAVSGIDTATRGTTYFDAFVSRRQTFIGP